MNDFYANFVVKFVLNIYFVGLSFEFGEQRISVDSFEYLILATFVLPQTEFEIKTDRISGLFLCVADGTVTTILIFTNKKHI